MKQRVIVIGGGASGMMAAAAAASKGVETILLEKNEKLGKKLYITGKGRCNVTNQCDVEEIIENTPGNGNFLYSALNSFDNHRLRDLLNGLGVPTKVERGNRVFPVSDKSSDIIKALEKLMRKHSVSINLNKRVSGIKVHNGCVNGVYIDNKDFLRSTSVVVATGGLSYPSTGSNGDGYGWAAELGHSISCLRPSLVPLEIREDWAKGLQGLALKNVKVKALTTQGKSIREEFGELIFTHFGVSGPVILTISRFIYDWIDKGVRLNIDLKPALSHGTLNARILRDFSQGANRRAESCLNSLLPRSLATTIFGISGIDAGKKINQITRGERQHFVNTLKGLNLNVTGVRPYSEAVVTAGGVSTDEVDPGTMESKLVKGLMFAGEVLDIDALTGGFNLQIAFSTGYLAGISCR